MADSARGLCTLGGHGLGFRGGKEGTRAPGWRGTRTLESTRTVWRDVPAVPGGGCHVGNAGLGDLHFLIFLRKAKNPDIQGKPSDLGNEFQIWETPEGSNRTSWWATLEIAWGIGRGRRRTPEAQRRQGREREQRDTL